jgi:1-acyl-sn-glycerol-3-phosphate acyltransferase
MSIWMTFLVAVACWIALVLLARLAARLWFSRGPGGKATTGLLWHVLRAYCRVLHRVRFTGLEHVPATNRPGSLVVVSNHTGPVDPLLIQAGCRFEIRWMMAANMMIRQLDWLWRRHRMIAVARDGRDTGPAREAIRHVRDGGVIGIFPEGAIVQPRGEVRPFHEGVGLIISRTGAPVLLAWVSGTSPATEMFPALVTPSQARVHFIGLLEFEPGTDPARITAELRQRIVQASGWRANDDPLIPPRRNPDPFAAHYR